VPIEVDVDRSVTVHADPDHLEQVVSNLLVNGHRYGAPPFGVRTGQGEGRGWIEVVDHGPGLPGGLDGGLLEPFVQGDSGDRRVSSGVGLGLTICRDLVAANGGDLTYVDTPGGGATFRITLPLA
jgi:two-component system OmpR family sensor kinase